MFQIAKDEPSYFKNAKAKIALPKVSDAWNDTNISNIRSQLREDILFNEQKSLCVYCEKKIDSDSKNSNIDHFKTRNLFPDKTLHYENLLVSCKTKGRCSSFKDKQVKQKEDYSNIINPISENPDDFFDYLLTGEMIAIDNNSRANFTIFIFNLGCKESDNLTQTRKQIAISLMSLSNLSLDEIYSVLGNEFCSFVKIVHKKLNSTGEIS